MIPQKYKYKLTGLTLTSSPCVCWPPESRCLSCLCTLGEAKGESGGTGEGDSDTGRPSEDSEEPLGCRRRLLKCDRNVDL